jgi:hypothetical protein
VTPPPSGSTTEDDRDEACADAIEPHVIRLTTRASAAGWSEAEVVTALLSLVVSEMRSKAGDRATRETLASVILMLDE